MYFLVKVHKTPFCMSGVNNILKRHDHHRNSSLSFALQVSGIMQTAVPDHSSQSKWAGLQIRNNGAISANVLVVGSY